MESQESTSSFLSREDMDAVFQLCRQDEWDRVLLWLKRNPEVGITPMIMDNHITTTVLHQAITSKGATLQRAQVIRWILRKTPEAAAMKNGYGSLPLHVISQRNTKMDAQTKEALIFELVKAYREGLTEEGGVGKRTPLHIIFTDYISPRLTRMMIEQGASACFKRDRKGYLPAHVACSRHCSPEKLRMLLEANPDALYAETNDGETLLSLATNSATKAHPNFTLLRELRSQIEQRAHQAGRCEGAQLVTPISSRSKAEDLTSPSLATCVSTEVSTRSRVDSNDSMKTWHSSEFTSGYGEVPRAAIAISSRKRKCGGSGGNVRSSDPYEDPAGLLLHFSRNGSPRTSLNGTETACQPSQIAEV